MGSCLPEFRLCHRDTAGIGDSYVDASYLTGVSEKQLTVSQFISISRELDLGGQLHAKLRKTLASGGKLQQLIETSARAHLLFEALDAYRNRATTGVTLDLYEKLVVAINGSGKASRMRCDSRRTRRFALKLPTDSGNITKPAQNSGRAIP